jgi:predicted nucleotidyltransferase
MESHNKPVQDKKALLLLIAAHKDSIRSFGVSEIGFFGSFVRNEMNENSDVDFLVDFHPEKKTYNNFIHLAYFLENLCGRRVELVTRKGLSKYIGPKILDTTEYVAITN